jgi:ribose 5-phosphate isomerase B
MIIGIGSDHAGYSLKEHILKFLKETYSEFDLRDYGCKSSSDSVDYPNIAASLCGDLSKGNLERGILVCGSGVGMSIAANRVKGVRATLCSDLLTARLCREHNDSNVLCLGNWFVTPKLSEEILNIWLKTKFAAGRHQKRVSLLG